jgi:hypothetical protein
VVSAVLSLTEARAKHSSDEGDADLTDIDHKVSNRLESLKQTQPSSRKRPADSSESRTKNAGRSKSNAAEKEDQDGTQDPEGCNKQVNGDQEEDVSFVAEGDTESTPLDPDVRQQKFLKTPLPFGQYPSQFQIDTRIHALHLRIGPWVGVNTHTLREILQAEGWDFESAISRWDRDLAVRKTHHLISPVGRTYETILEDKFLSSPSLHQNHRLGIDHIYSSLGLKQLSIAPAKRFRLTSLRCALILRESNWDLGIAEECCMNIVNGVEERERFLRRDRRLRLVIGNEPNQLHKDERVALFMEIAGTDDYTSAEDMVRVHGWDLGVVIDDWMGRGLPLVPHNRKLLLNVTFAAPRFFHTETDNLWPASRPSAHHLSGVDQADRDDYDLDYEQGTRANRRGWIINHDGELPLVGLVQPQKMRIDMIRNGEFKVLRYHKKPSAKGTKRKTDGVGEAVKSDQEGFDWTNLHHIGKLVAWRRQPSRGVAGNLKKEKAQAYHEQEDKWIFDWHAAERDRMLDGESVEDHRAGGGRWPLKYSAKKFSEDFNAEFEGRTDLADTNGEPRQHRTQAGLDVRRKRIIAVCETFGLTFCPAHKKDVPEE